MVRFHRKYYMLGLLFMSGLLLSLCFLTLQKVQAADGNFSNGITVDNKGDGADSNVGDNICDDGSGNCTLRAAIEESNATTGAQTINFNITGTADFTNNGQNGYTIQPTSGLPTITDTVTINGYSQPGAAEDVSNIVNARLLIEIDGTGLGDVGGLSANSVTGLNIKGLIISHFGVSGGSKAWGLIVSNSSDVTVEGNIIEYNDDYFAAGIGFNTVTSSIVRNNITRENTGIGISLESACVDITIDRNQSNANTGNGISLAQGPSQITITNNVTYDNESTGIQLIGATFSTVGSVGQGNISYNNVRSNVQVLGASGFGFITHHITIQSNTLGRAGFSNGNGVTVEGDANNVMIGGTSAPEANRIVNGEGGGIGIIETILYLGASPDVSVRPYNVSVLGNSISGSRPELPYPGFSSGLGIDQAIQYDTEDVPNGLANTFTGLGPTLNDSGDTDTGPNNYINFPVINSVDQNNLNLSVNFNLDALDSPANQYRVEFFANDSADPSGYGEGQTYLGYATVSPGNNQTANITLPAGTNLTGKVLSATTTAIDNTTTSGFGSTSEFSLASNITVSALPQANSGNLANTGQNVWLLGIISATAILIGCLMFQTRRYLYSARM